MNRIKLIILAMVLLSGFSCSESDVLEASAEKTEEEMLCSDRFALLDSAGTALQSFPEHFGEYRLVIDVEGEWNLECTDSFLRLEKKKGIGKDTIWALIAPNWAARRTAELELQISDQETRGSKDEVCRLSIAQASNPDFGSVSDKMNSSMGAGFSYSPVGRYCMGTGIQVFNMSHFKQLEKAHNTVLLTDDYYPSVWTRVFTADSLETLQTDLTIEVTADVDLKLFTLNVSGKYNDTSVSGADRKYAVQRLTSSLFTRDLHYMNAMAIVAENPALRTFVFAPGFLLLHDALVKDIQATNDPVIQRSLCESFVNVVGPCFVTKSVMGCGMDYYVSSEKKYVTDSMTIDAILKFKWESTFNIEASSEGNYTELKKQARDEMKANFDIRGGRIEKVSILNTGGTLPYKDLMQWTVDMDPDEAVLVDMRLEPIYLLFADKKTKEALRSYIEKKE